MKTRTEEISNLISEIETIKSEMGKDLLILTHHYQRPEIVKLGHVTGDSFGLSLYASKEENARCIVFCGVHFMAESAKILSRNDQRVFMPDIYAGCPMADMADVSDLEYALVRLRIILNDKIIPVSYMNTTAETKAITGREGGMICTSSNAHQAFQKVLSSGSKILFLPDEHLGRNTANRLNIDRSQVALWDHTMEDGGLTREQIKRSIIFLWKGYCHVHTWFTPEHIKAARTKYPECIIIVHPECTEEVVALADGAGSTEHILKTVKNAKPEKTIVIGTEINMISRLAEDFPDKQIVELGRSICPNMYKITLNKLKNILSSFDSALEINVDPDMVHNAGLALRRMLELS